MKKAFIIVSCLVFCLVSGTASAEYKIGVLAKRGAPKCMKKWRATGDYLTEKTGEKFIIMPLKFKAIEPALKAKRIDFMLANSAFYVEMEKKFGVKAITTLINSREGQSLKEFGGVVFVRKDSDIQSLADIKGRKFMCVKYSSFGGGHMAWRLLLENGIDPKTDCAAFIEGKKHDNVVLAVKNGTVDVGTVRTDTMERMQEEGRIQLSDFRIIREVKDEFPFVRSTRLYPEWPLAACATTDEQVADKVASALKSMSPTSKAAKDAKVTGWTEPLAYGSVRECLQKIRYGSFK